MDISLLKTFLEVARARHFGHAAENLCITQSAVSARIKLIEDQLQVPMFTRDRNNIQLTAAGQRFSKHAESILDTWNRARQDVLLSTAAAQLISVGATYSLWDILLERWLIGVHQRYPQTPLRTETTGAESLMRMLLDKVLDLGFLFEPPQVQKLEMEEVASLDLVLVSTRPDLRAQQAVNADDYIMVDWGTAFAIEHAREFQEAGAAKLSMNAAKTALGFLQACGGSAYLARPMVQQLITEARLYTVTDAPVIKRNFYAVYHSQNVKLDDIKPLIEFLRTDFLKGEAVI